MLTRRFVTVDLEIGAGEADLRRSALNLIAQLEDLQGLGVPAGVVLPAGDGNLLRTGVTKALGWASSRGREPTGVGVVYGAASDGVLRSYNFVGFATLGNVRWQAVIRTPDKQWSRKGPPGPIPTGDRYVVARTESQVEHRSGRASYWTRKLQVYGYAAPLETTEGVEILDAPVGVVVVDLWVRRPRARGRL